MPIHSMFCASSPSRNPTGMWGTGLNSTLIPLRSSPSALPLRSVNGTSCQRALLMRSLTSARVSVIRDGSTPASST